MERRVRRIGSRKLFLEGELMRVEIKLDFYHQEISVFHNVLSTQVYIIINFDYNAIKTKYISGA